MKLTRSEIVGLAALFLAFAGQAALDAAVEPKVKQGQRPALSWDEQERGVQKKIQDTFALDRQEFEKRLQENPALLQKFGRVTQALFFVLLASLYLFFRSAYRFWRGRPLEPPLAEPPRASWGLRDVLRILLWGIASVQWIMLGEKWIFLAARPPWMDRHVLALGNTLSLDLAVLVLALLLMRRAANFAPAVSPGPVLWQIRFGFAAYLAFLPVLFSLLLAVAGALQFLGKIPPPQPVFTLYFSEDRAEVLRLLIALVTLIGPVAEEVFFRGIVYRWLRMRWSIPKAVAVSAFFFALLHGDPVAFVPIFALGVLFGWVYERTGSLWAPVTLHVAHNAGMLFLASLVKELAAL